MLYNIIYIYSSTCVLKMLPLSWDIHNRVHMTSTSWSSIFSHRPCALSQTYGYMTPSSLFLFTSRPSGLFVETGKQTTSKLSVLDHTDIILWNLWKKCYFCAFFLPQKMHVNTLDFINFPLFFYIKIKFNHL